MSNVSPDKSLNRKQLLLANNPGFQTASLSPRQNSKYRLSQPRRSRESDPDKSVANTEQHAKASAERQSYDDYNNTEHNRVKVVPFDV